MISDTAFLLPQLIELTSLSGRSNQAPTCYALFAESEPNVSAARLPEDLGLQDHSVCCNHRSVDILLKAPADEPSFSITTSSSRIPEFASLITSDDSSFRSRRLRRTCESIRHENLEFAEPTAITSNSLRTVICFLVQ